MEPNTKIKAFPDNEIEFDSMFLSEEQCATYLFEQRWGEGFKCVKCSGTDYWKSERNLYVCKDCEHQHSITAGTILHKTHKPLRLWFKAIWMFTTTKSGISATNLSR